MKTVQRKGDTKQTNAEKNVRTVEAVEAVKQKNAKNSVDTEIEWTEKNLRISDQSGLVFTEVFILVKVLSHH